MGRCSGCSGTRPVIEAGAGIKLTGAMTPANPLVITAEGDGGGGGGGGGGWSPGDVKWTASPVVQAGWLVPDGRPVSRSIYAVLWAALGSPNTGDGSTTFDLPDLTGRFVLGADGSHPIGSSGGAESVTLTGQHIAAHDHPLSSNGKHDHNAGRSANDGTSFSTYRTGSGTDKVSDASLIQQNQDHTHTVKPNRTDAPTPVPTMPPYGALMPLIKT